MSASGEKVNTIIGQIENGQNTSEGKTINEVVDIFLKGSADDNSCFPVRNHGPYFDMEELRHWKEQMNQTYQTPYNREILCLRRHFCRTVIFIKRLIRKMCRSLIQPIVEEQNTFNANTTAAVNALYNNEIVTEAFIADTKDFLEECRERLRKTDKQDEDKQDAETKDLEVRKEIEEYIQKEINDVKKMVLEKTNHLEQTMFGEIQRENKEYVEEKIKKSEQVFAEEIHKYENELKRNYEQWKAETEWRHTQDEMRLFRNTRWKLYEQNANGGVPASETDCEKDVYQGIDYFDFENHFRGSRQEIKRRQSVYLPYFQDKNLILDLGCGRGEFLELLKENGIHGLGIDHYIEFAEYCRAKELDVRYGDAIKYLASIENNSVGGIFAAQLIEHLSEGQLLELCRLVYEKLEKGGCLIMETPNPMCLSTYTNSFYIDPSHQKPVHPKMMEYLLKREGFCKVEILFTEESKSGCRLPRLSSGCIDNLNQFNEGMDTLSDLLFGSEDYAVIAQK